MNRHTFIGKVAEYIEDKWAVDFGRHGYSFKLNVEPDEFPMVKMTTNNLEMPVINVATVSYGDHGFTRYQFECNLEFPNIEYDSDYDYADHTSYIISSLWAPLGKTITEFQKWDFSWDDYDEESFM